MTALAMAIVEDTYFDNLLLLVSSYKNESYTQFKIGSYLSSFCEHIDLHRDVFFSSNGFVSPDIGLPKLAELVCEQCRL
jgi:hypothetical protein